MGAFKYVCIFFFLAIFKITFVSRLWLVMYDVTSFTHLQSQTPARNSRKSTHFSRKHRRCRLAQFFVSTRGIITTMAVHKDDVVDFDWLANKEELEEVLCVLAGSDPENCSYSRVSRGRECRRLPLHSQFYN